jgi:GSH-dependent disulfide-bond oxidoreductase
MLNVYHWEPSGASGRVLIALAEKGLEFTSHYVDLLALEQYRPAILELSDSGEIPIVVHDGAAYAGESAVCELLEEAYPARALMPPDPHGRWEVRVWQKYVDDGFAASVSELAWQAYGVSGDGAPTAKLRAAVEKIAVPRQREAWSEALAGYSQERLSEARTRVAAAVTKIEAALGASRWLAGAEFTLADVAVFPYLKYLPRLAPAMVDEASAPRTAAWLGAVAERPAVREILARARTADPFAVAAAGPEQIRWG